MNFDLLLKGLVEAGKGPLAYSAYTILVVCIFFVIWKDSRIKIIANSLKELPENQRLEALKLEYNLEPKEGMDVTSFLIIQKRKYYLALGLAALALVLILGTLGIYRYIELDKRNIFAVTLKMASDAQARGTTSADNNQFSDAIGRLEESIKLYPSYQAYMSLADIYDNVGDTQAALAASRRAAELDHQNPSPDNYIGIYLKDLGDFDGAEKHLKLATEKFDKMHRADPEFRVTLLVNLGNLYAERADAAEGPERKRLATIALKQYFQPALELFGQIKDERITASALGNIGNAYAIVGNYKEAQNFTLQSIDIKNRIYKNDPLYSSIGFSHANLAYIYINDKQINNAINEIKISSKIHSDKLHSVGWALTLLSQGQVDIKFNRIENARKILGEARNIFMENHVQTYASRCEKLISQLPAT